MELFWTHDLCIEQSKFIVSLLGHDHYSSLCLLILVILFLILHMKSKVYEQTDQQEEVECRVKNFYEVLPIQIGMKEKRKRIIKNILLSTTRRY